MCTGKQKQTVVQHMPVLTHQQQAPICVKRGQCACHQPAVNTGCQFARTQRAQPLPQSSKDAPLRTFTT